MSQATSGKNSASRAIPHVADAQCGLRADLRGRSRARALRPGQCRRDGLSIGFRTVKGRIDPATRVRRLIDLELWEISIVTFPLLAGARVRAVKAAAPGEDE